MNENPSAEDTGGLVAAAWFMGAGAVLFFCGCLVLWFACLRETPDFWRNSGGYPILLRDAVLVLFYPLLAIDLLGLLALSFAWSSKIRMPEGFGCFATLVMVVCWLLAIGSMLVAFSNNIRNFWNEHPLHYKPSAQGGGKSIQPDGRAMPPKADPPGSSRSRVILPGISDPPAGRCDT